MDCLLTGIGGQGIVFASKLISQTAINKGLRVRTAETIGMAQRGGSVVSHVRIGDETFSPLLGLRSAEVIVAFEPGEAARVYPYLAPGGAMILCDKGQQSPADALLKKNYYPDSYIDALKESGSQVYVVQGDAIIDALSTSKVLNVALVGAACASGNLGLTYDELEKTIHQIAPEKFIDLNISALKIGYESIKSATIK